MKIVGKLGAIVALFTLLGVSVFTFFMLHIPQSECDVEAFARENPIVGQSQAVQVVFKPWRGHHHVYALFPIPDYYRFGQQVLLQVKGAQDYCTATYVLDKSLDGFTAPPGYALTKNYIRTRTALWLTLRYGINHVRQPDNWTITYRE